MLRAPAHMEAHALPATASSPPSTAADASRTVAEPLEPTNAPASFVLREWRWPNSDATRFRVRSHYAERLWLPMLGPTALLLVRLLAEFLDETGDGVAIDLGLAALALGVGSAAPGQRSSTVRALARLERFGFVRINGDELLVRVELPALNDRDVLRLPQWLQARHARATGSE